MAKEIEAVGAASFLDAGRIESGDHFDDGG
jgi:hypothetical protein